LWCDDAAEGVAAGEKNAAVVDLSGGLGGGESGAINQCAAAGGTPVGLGFGSEDGVAMAADSLHLSTISHFSRE